MIMIPVPTLRIGCYYGESFRSKIIQFRTWGPIGHVSLVFGDDVIEAVPQGVIRQVGFDQHHTPGTRIDLFCVDAEAHQIRMAYAFARAQLGKKYDWGGVYGFLVRRDRQNHEKWFCSELTFAACEYAGIHLLARIEAHKVSPVDLWRSPRLVYERTIRTKSTTLAKNAQEGPKSVFRGTGVATAPIDQYAACLRPNAAWSRGCHPQFLPVGLVSLPNSGSAASDFPIFGMPNAVTVGEAGAPPSYMDVPYGDVPIKLDKVVGIQRLNRRVADAMVEWLHSWRGQLANRFVGFPVYKGHPDNAYFRSRGDTDEDAQAWVQDMQATETCLRLSVEWTPPGQVTLANKARKFFSPYFLGEVVGRENGVTIYEPKVLKSVGLTNSPNWPVEPLVNAENPDGYAVTTEDTNTMNLLERLLALINLESIKTEDDVVNYVGKLVDAIKKLRAAEQARWAADDAARASLVNAAGPVEMVDLALGMVESHCVALINQIAELGAARDGNKTELDRVQAELTAMAERVKTERGARVKLLVNAAVQDGRVTLADQAKWKTDLVNASDIDAQAELLAKLPRTVKTTPVTRNLGARDASVHERREKTLDLVNKRMADKGETYEVAFGVIKAENPTLFGDGK